MTLNFIFVLISLLDLSKQGCVYQSGGFCFFTELYFSVALLVRDCFSVGGIANLKD